MAQLSEHLPRMPECHEFKSGLRELIFFENDCLG